MESELYIVAAFKTDAGLVRENNEDAVLFYQPADPRSLEKRGVLAVVADGVGGNNSGEVASSLAVEAVQEHYYDDVDSTPIAEALQRAIEAANKHIMEVSTENPEYDGMATTCTALAFCGGEVVVAHVGDSRAYRFRRNELLRLTKDHTLVHDLLKKGLISEEEAKSHPQANVITRALGSQADLEVDIVDLVAEADDCYLLCSDGLSNQVTEEEMAEIVSSCPPPESCETMVDLARQRGGYDNITVQVIKLAGNDQHNKGKTKKLTYTYGYMPIPSPKFFMLLFLALGIITSVLAVSIYFLESPLDVYLLFRNLISEP